MSIISVIMACFSVLGGIDRILGNRFGLGKEFERGLMLLGTMAVTMIGMIVIAPLLAVLMEPMFTFVWNMFHIDPSSVPAALFANDMGGAPLSLEVAKDPAVGGFNAFVVSSMMGCTVSFTIPFALGAVKETQHKDMLLGLLCGIVTIPLGCFAGGLVCGIPLGTLLWNLFPLVIFAAVIAFGLMKFPDACIKIFGVFGTIIKIIITVGLVVGIVRFLTGVALLPHTDTFEAGGSVILNASAVMTGAFPLMYVLSKILQKPCQALGKRLKINDASAMGFLGSMTTSAISFGNMGDMDKKGTVLNSAYAVSAAFIFAGHLAFTLAYGPEYLPAMIVGKLVAGVLSLFVAVFIYRRVHGESV